ncbi:bifunctional proline dehydrogenase/L-glutamate gamma-semialdehyde dehydrogenase PutA [Limimaricola sp.]|uniref:bifunctional proline dehydrogenase/L-glutamate gamma-semialdehyde dehydrogenase PutA n=1 Tax=Limimaricola sp. TaxID=2211665 RepID=UPI004059995D
MSELDDLRIRIRADHRRDEAKVLADLMAADPISPEIRAAATRRGAALVRAIRNDTRPGIMEAFLAEYGLSTREGIALMCLAEALLRVPDAKTIDALIDDKITPSDWSAHLGKAASPLVNASTWALMLTGKVLDEKGEGLGLVLRRAIKRLGEPVIRAATYAAMREMGRTFVLGRDIDEAIKRSRGPVKNGTTYSYDMLGEAALTAKDAAGFMKSYADAIARISKEATARDIRDNPGISVKLSALHPRYEEAQRERVMAELVPRLTELARAAKKGNMGLNVDAEEADRLDLSLDIIEAVLSDPELAGWDGFGVVVQAFGRRVGGVIDWLYALSEKLDRKIMVRLVKGAYWDTEIKRAQVDGLPDFPVFTEKAATDVAWLSCAKRLLGMTDRIYPQFATHNAHSVAAVMEMAGDRRDFEFQRLHGMGEALHDKQVEKEGTRLRIYAPVGAHRDLLAYLVRRLLENGANSSFVNQIVDEKVPAEVVAADPFEKLGGPRPKELRDPRALFQPERENSRGWDLTAVDQLAEFDAGRNAYRDGHWSAGPLLAAEVEGGERLQVTNPADPGDVVGEVVMASEADVETAITHARRWQAPASTRGAVLRKAADLYEEHAHEFFALTAREAGKTPKDAVAELREAVDFLRYYAARGEELKDPARGTFACISPWNFPLAIFTGQISAALAAGNAVLAKPAESTPLVAALGTRLLHEAGVPREALQLLPGEGRKVGAAITSDPRISGVCFTGSTETAIGIDRAMAANMDPTAPLIAETGGLNAMIVDSTALPEQAVRDIVNSAFQSAGQRCSALRMLYVQEDVADRFLEMLKGATEEMGIGDPWKHSTDVGPVIDARAEKGIMDHVEKAKREGRLVWQLGTPEKGHYVGPALIKLNGIEELEREVFGPVLHVATFRAGEIDEVIDAVNATGYGLTFGLHTRIDERVEQVTQRVKVGNLYVNRNQIGAIVGSQPFGGEGLSGTGPKAGGPHYVARFTEPPRIPSLAANGPEVPSEKVQALLDQAMPDPDRRDTVTLPGPTGESNRLSVVPRGTVLCLGPSVEEAQAQMAAARAAGNAAIGIAPGLEGEDTLDGTLDPAALEKLDGFDAVALRGGTEALRPFRAALATRDGRRIPLLAEEDIEMRLHLERHVCVDTTAAGGNASLLASVG